MAVNGVMGTGPSSAAPAGTSAAGMKSEDFYKLLIAELRYQDPMQPMDNSKMVEQVAGIRNIEASTTMTNTLKSVTRQQNFGTASSLIGKQVLGKLADDSGYEQTISGVVTGVRFESNGTVVLELDNGTSLPLDAVTQTSSLGGSPREQALGDAADLIGKVVSGEIVDSKGNRKSVAGTVRGVQFDASGRAILELDTGVKLPMIQLTHVQDQSPPATSAGTSGSDTTGDSAADSTVPVEQTV